MIKIEKIEVEFVVGSIAEKWDFKGITIPNHPPEFELVIRSTKDGVSLKLKNLDGEVVAENEIEKPTEQVITMPCYDSDCDGICIQKFKEDPNAWCKIINEGGSWESCEFGKMSDKHTNKEENNDRL